ncbi:MAG: glycosyltransferase [Oscillospiraceae bacterium]|jgi:glycosyltransferase involved in cell wall biosynthesis|nr:glycosyltransferase [Oscillospiraceae bacterium]
MNHKVSVITPVYKSEQYLEETLSSLAEQDYSNVEFILVDDCGGDGSVDICEYFAEQDSRFVLLRHTENRCASAGYNTGIEYALENGSEYIMFLDNDDIAEPNFVSSAVELITRTGTDIAAFDYEMFTEQNGIRVKYPDIYKTPPDVLPRNRIIKPLQDPPYLTLFNGPWIKIRRADLLRKHKDVRFQEVGGVYFGDISFWAKEFYYAKTFVLSDVCLAKYRVTHTNSTNKINNCDGYFNEFHETRRFITKHNAHGTNFAKVNFDKSIQTLEGAYNGFDLDEDTKAKLKTVIDRYLSEEKALGNC